MSVGLRAGPRWYAPPAETPVTAFLKRISDAPWFQNFITAVIILAGIVVGIET